MRNLKKFLALVLAMMMVFSLMITVNASWSSGFAGTGFVDDDSIPAAYDEAVQVLSQLGVFRGTDDGSEFEPNRTFTRAQVAAVVYRIASGDTLDRLVGQDGGYSNYDDLPEDHWANAYINYDTIAGYMVGTDDGNFAPDRPVNGYEVLATILRVIGYDKNGEFTGATWQQKTSSTARTLGITNGISATQLQQPATRALVAELLFRTITKTTTVRYNAQYLDYESKNYTLAWDVFSLFGGGSDTTPGEVTAGSAAVPKAPYVSATQADLMTDRHAAVADPVYGAPMAFWYRIVNGEPDVIPVTFNAAKAYTTAVTVQTVYADLGLSAPSVRYNYQVDGTNGGITPGNLVKNNVNGLPIWVGDGTTGSVSSLKNFTDYGVLTEVYVADGQIFITSVNTYIDMVKTEYVSKAQRMEMNNATDASIDYILYEEDDIKAVVGSLEERDVVIYHQYMFNESSASEMLGYEITNGDVYIDCTTIHKAPVEDVTVIDTVDQPDTTPTSQVSNFRSSSKTYRYNPKYNLPLKPDSSKAYLNREDYAAGQFPARQFVYKDDYGYVLYLEPYAAASVKGYALVRFGGETLSKDPNSENGRYDTFSVYLEDGSEQTFKGAIKTGNNKVNNGIYEDGTQNPYTSEGVPAGLYGYELMSNGFYELYRIDATTASIGGIDTDLRIKSRTVDGETSIGEITVGNLAVLGSATNNSIDATTGLLTNNTRFFVAEYNSGSSVIAKWQQYVGIADLPHLKGRTANIDVGPENDATSGVMWVEYVMKGGATPGEITMVVIRNAKTETDDDQTSALKTFILNNRTTVKHTEPDGIYNWYENVIVDGANGTVKFKTNDNGDCVFDYYATPGDTTNCKKDATEASLASLTPYEYTLKNGYVEKVYAISNEASEAMIYRYDGALQDATTSTVVLALAKDAKVYEVGATGLTAREQKYLTAANSRLSGGLGVGWNVYVIKTNAKGLATEIYVTPVKASS